MMVRIAALLASHNRVLKTVGCLEALLRQENVGGAIDIVLCDAGSTDGTPEQVRARFSDVVVLEASPSLFWNAGMRLAFEHAVKGDYDFYLWLNDDTTLDPDAVHVLLATHADPLVRRGQPAIVAGAVRDPVSGVLTYGGVVRRDRVRPLKFSHVPPSTQPVEVDTVNGNCVLIPRSVVRRIGLLDPGFTHAMGDFDYGLRARAAGATVWMAPGTVGVCARNPEPTPAPSFRQHLERLGGPKELPPREWVRFARRWAGPLWPLYAASPFLRRTVTWARSLR